MSRTFSSRDAKTLINRHKDLEKKLQAVLKQYSEYESGIKQAANELRMSRTLEVLRDVPIEEVNREKRGIRVASLHRYGIHTIADIAPVPVRQLASIHGIGQETAFVIRREADRIIRQTEANTKVRISADNRSPAATKLIKMTSSLRMLDPQMGGVRTMLGKYGKDIQSASIDLAPAASVLKWFFSSKKTRQRAEGAYRFLSDILDGEYGQTSNNIIVLGLHTAQMSDEEAWLDFQSNSIAFFNILEYFAPGLLSSVDGSSGLPEDIARGVREQEFFPDGLRCTLRRYQEWGVKYILHQERVLLGDEMGLGKTIQAIASMVSLRNTGATHFMVVCPASVVTNWCREIEKKSRLTAVRIHGTDRLAALRAWMKEGGVAVTTYETTGFFDLDNDFRFSMLVVDEAHYVKNPQARRSVNVRNLSLHADRLLFMTGTALENKVKEMISLIRILQPSVAEQVKGIEFLSAAPLFRHKVAPVYYRRKREDVLTELPEKVENREWCTLLPEEERIYEHAVLSRRFTDARRVSWNVPDLRKSSKARRMMEIINEAAEEERKVLVFSFFLNTIENVMHLLGERCYGPINGSVSPERRQSIIDEFNQAPAGSVLAAQIQSGGTGLNIQSATVVIICEPQFKPSIENQAISRAYRMGQTRNVLVYRLLCENTVDERITDLLQEKQAIFDAFADESIAAQKSIALDEKNFGNIIEDEIERIKNKTA